MRSDVCSVCLDHVEGAHNKALCFELFCQILAHLAGVAVSRDVVDRNGLVRLFLRLCPLAVGIHRNLDVATHDHRTVAWADERDVQLLDAIQRTDDKLRKWPHDGVVVDLEFFFVELLLVRLVDIHRRLSEMRA